MKFKKIAITGGAGYVGSALVPHLIRSGHEVTVVDLFWYGESVLEGVPDPKRLRKCCVDIRDEKRLAESIADADAVIHLACISNDPSFDLDAGLGRTINYDAFFGLLRAVRQSRARRFIYASTSSVYGIKNEKDVHEECSCEPLTDYSKYKLMCEKVLQQEGVGDCEYLILRPATVCGYAPRLRLDLAVNILTINALVKKKITLFGGSQLRPNINIQDMVKVYQLLLEADSSKVDRQIFNAGYQNRSLADIAEMVKKELAAPNLPVVVQKTDDNRSYHISSRKIRDVLGFEASSTIEEAIRSLREAYEAGQITDPLENTFYYNIKRMKELRLSS